MKRTKKGFTLIEVIVVLVILALLAAIMIPSMVGWIDKAREKRLIVSCRTCVLAAQTLLTEDYALNNSAAVPDSGKVVQLAGVNGTADNISVEASIATINTLTYDEDGDSVTYERLPSPHYTFGASAAPSAAAWTSGKSYAAGDTVLIDNTYFACIRPHTSGTASTTRNPTTGSNKSTWEVTGFASGANTNYDSRFRYAEGVVVTTTGDSYRRTSYNPSSSPTPYNGSPYWALV